MDTSHPTEKLEGIARNLSRVTEKIALAAHSVGRAPDEVQLVVVSKLHSIESIRAAIQGGARKFGENYAEEGAAKIKEISSQGRLEWHMIGHIQSRKAHLVAYNFDLVHSVDSLKIAERLNAAREGNNRPLPVLLEINLSGEESKSGWQAQNDSEWEGLLPEIVQVIAQANLQVIGLMTMPPLSDNPEMARPYFRQLVRCRDFLCARLRLPGTALKELSMGTSHDYEVAVQEGATILRVGQAILGPRPAR